MTTKSSLAEPSEAMAHPIPRRSWLTLWTTSLVGFMVSLEITVIALALPEIRLAFNTSAESTLSWIITAYNIGLAALLLVAGWAADRFGRKRLFLTGLVVFAIGSALAGAAPNVGVLIGARLVQSIGGAMQFPSGLALLLAAFPPQRRQMAIGVWGAMGGLAAAVGPPLGGFLVGGFGWRSVFWVNVPIALAATAGGNRWLTESRSGEIPSRVDLISIPLGTIGVGSIVAGIVKAPDWGWGSGQTITVFAIGAALIALFVYRSKHHESPLFDLDLFKARSYTLGNLGSVCFVVAFFAYFVPLPTFIQQIWGWSVLETGLILIPGPLLAALLSPVSGRLADRFGVAPVLTIGGVAGAASMTLHLLLTGIEPAALQGMVLPGTVLGISAGFSFAMLVGATMQDVAPGQFAMAGAGRTTVFQLSIAMAIAVGVAIIGRPAGAADHLDAIRVVWLLALVLFVSQAVIFGVLFPAPSSTR
ncbi:MAG: DHA2 family efflux MFS transporter permease subunit [Actinomycetia bacterium]|nr:DHA2 family efflux MFS transporter permease subunit [Actinomycetes bacterium]MCP5031708.1 DHA2 family efflux MFS transporter permease subunit [Actinomycetes bacterium]